MKFARRDVLKLGALGLVGTTCVTKRSASETPPMPPVGLQTPAPKESDFVLTFGSCNKPDLAQPMWSWVRAQRPDAWMWLGDIVYADTEDMERTRSLYRRQRVRQNPENDNLLVFRKI